MKNDIVLFEKNINGDMFKIVFEPSEAIADTFNTETEGYFLLMINDKEFLPPKRIKQLIQEVKN